MRSKVSKRQLLICTSFSIITFSNAHFFIERGWDNPIAYFGYFMLLCGIILSYLRLPNAYKTNINRNIMLALLSFSIGILLQPIGIVLKLRLLLTMLVIAISALASDGLMRTFEDIRVGAYGLFLGEVGTFLLSILTKTRIFSDAEETVGLFNQGFNAGMSHKNYFAMILMASFSTIYIYRKYAKKRLVDLIILFVEGILLFFSHARAVWILTLLFLIIISMDKVRVHIRLSKAVRLIGISIAFGVVIIAVWWIYPIILKHSKTYLSRFSGFTSYWFTYCKNDTFHRIFGNAATFFGTDDYYENFRMLMNYGGAVDMAILNILIKNGLIGLIGYFLIFGRIIKQAVETNLRKLSTCCFAIVIPMIISMFSENCVSTISLSYAPFCYVVLSSLYRQMRSNGEKKTFHFSM